MTSTTATTTTTQRGPTPVARATLLGAATLTIMAAAVIAPSPRP
ncbi:hypothetical protein [Kibdelosporangium persicum]|nr:hypothetical protein [Kibdelosporangium persicum]